MLAQYSQGCSVTVMRERQLLTAEINNFTTFRDDWLQINLSLPDLAVKAAYLETVRNRHGDLLSCPINDLVGRTVNFALFSGTADVAIPCQSGQGGYYRRMLLELFTAVLQSETFFYTERGFDCPAAYDQFWKEFSRNSCRYYSNLDRIGREFSEHVSDQSRKHLLFSRQRHAMLEQRGDTLAAAASVRDSFHEMHTSWVIDTANLTILKAGGRIVRAPDQICAETEALFKLFQGRGVIEANRKDLRSLVDGPQGCAHFGDLTVDMIWLVHNYMQL